MTKTRILAGLLLALSQAAGARCALVFGNPRVELGQSGVAQLLPSGIPGFRQLGPTRSRVLSIECEAARTSLRLRFTQLSGRGDRLLRWPAASPAGALQLRLANASADGAAVRFDAAERQGVATIDIERDAEVVALDLHALPGGARRFTLEVQMTGLVEDTFRPVGRVDFSVSPAVELLDP